jgi:2-oxoisovalerate dehydrogenase E1 component alpha subunit
MAFTLSPVHWLPSELAQADQIQLMCRMPQAAGAAYALKLDEERQGDCVICYFGDGEFLHSHEADLPGAASEGDFHAALGMNSVLGGPCIWFCRNNGQVLNPRGR